MNCDLFFNKHNDLLTQSKHPVFPDEHEPGARRAINKTATSWYAWNWLHRLMREKS